MPVVSACVPTTAAYLRIPVTTDDGRPRRATLLQVPLDELRRQLRVKSLDHLAFFHDDRAPIPHRLADLDGDGDPDVAEVVLPIRGDGETRLIALCPGPTADAGTLPDAPRDEGVQLQLDDAVR